MPVAQQLPPSRLQADENQGEADSSLQEFGFGHSVCGRFAACMPCSGVASAVTALRLIQENVVFQTLAVTPGVNSLKNRGCFHDHTEALAPKAGQA